MTEKVQIPREHYKTITEALLTGYHSSHYTALGWWRDCAEPVDPPWEPSEDEIQWGLRWWNWPDNETNRMSLIAGLRRLHQAGGAIVKRDKP